ncbi:hypothetical protein CTI14_55710, partial [Methylobacterium radiotolerans]
EALQPLRPLLRMLAYDLNDPMPVVTLGLGAEFHLVSVRLIDEDTLMTDLPVGEIEQTAENLQRLLEELPTHPFMRAVGRGPAAPASPAADARL